MSRPDEWSEGADTSNVVPLFGRQRTAAASMIPCPPRLSAAVGLRWPVYISPAAFADAVAWTAEAEGGKPGSTRQSEASRWKAVLEMVLCAVRRAPYVGHGKDEAMPIQVWRLPAAGRRMTSTLTRLVVIAETAADGSAFLTVRRPDEVTPDSGWATVHMLREEGTIRTPRADDE